MNNAYIATAIALRDLHCDSLETINDRILLQKKIYLAQDIGLPLGYGYGWYIHGPYSTDLTAAAYEIIPEGFESIENNHFKADYAHKIDLVNGLEQCVKECSLRLDRVQWYELLASVAYWHKHGCKTEREVLTKIRDTKPQFTEEQTKIAYKSYMALKNPT